MERECEQCGAPMPEDWPDDICEACQDKSRQRRNGGEVKHA